MRLKNGCHRRSVDLSFLFQCRPLWAVTKGIFVGVALLLLAVPSHAGKGFTTTVSGRTTTFTQSVDKVFNRVENYNIKAGDAHTYIQPSSSAIFVQRVMGKNPSSILGSLNANGRVWIMNSGGVMIGRAARINTAGFMAASLVMGEDDFFAGRYNLNEEGFGAPVVNNGEITVTSNGCAILAGKSVVNNGRINAPDPRGILAQGSRISFDMDGDGLIRFNVDEKDVSGIVGGFISVSDSKGPGMTAEARRDIFDAVVNNDDLVEADSARSAGGRIILSSVSRSLSATSAGSGGDPYDSTMNGTIRRSNDVSIYAIHDVNINGLIESTGGSVTIMSDTDQGISGADVTRPGSVFLNADVEAKQDMTIDAHTGEILGLVSGQVVAGGNGNFHGRLTGTLAAPVLVDIQGNLKLAVDGHSRGVSGVIFGAAGYLDVAKTTPGMVFFNGSWIAHEGRLARAFAKSIVMDGPYRGVETGGMEALCRAEQLCGNGSSGHEDIRDFRSRLDIPGDWLYTPYPDLISDFRACEAR